MKMLRVPLRFLLLITLVIGVFPSLSAEPEYIELDPAAKPLDGLLPRGGIFQNPGKGYLRMPKQNLTISHQIDFAARSVEITQYYTNRLTGASRELWSSYYQELARYTMDMYDLGLQRLWLQSLIGQESQALDDGDGTVFDLSIPVNMPDWMKDFGLDKPKLYLKGTMDIRLLGRGEYIKEGNASRGSLVPTPTLDYVPSFLVKGQIGRNITVEVNNTEGGLGVRNQIKVVYAEADSGEFEDYILQRVEAGHTNLELQGTELTGYSENHQGLFGIKTQWKFGDLWLTTIASQEGGSQEEHTLKASESETEFQVLDKQFVAYKHYFLNMAYRNNYIRERLGGSQTTNIGRPPGLALYKIAPRTRETTQEDVIDDVTAIYRNGDEELRIGDLTLQRMQESEWSWNRRSGTVKINGGRRNALYAASWNEDGLSNSGRENGNVVLIQPDYYRSGSTINDLMLRNVYSVGITDDNQSTFRLSMKDRNLGSGNYLQILGVANEDGTIKTGQDYIFTRGGDGRLTGEMWLPCISKQEYRERGISISDAEASKRCLEPLQNLDTSGVYDRMYNRDVNTLNRFTTLYHFEAVGKRRQSSLNVRDQGSYSVSSGGCIDIAPGTEKLKAGSEVLVRERDYQVNYQLGQIELISDRALDPNKEITVSYECEPLFAINNKLLLGARAEMPLKDISENSLIGATALYKSQSVSQENPQFGGEPFRSTLFGANIRLTDEADWMDAFINGWPLIDTDAKSRWSVEGELARSWHDPNTSERNAALLDDFESAQRALSYSMFRTSWYQSSPPGGVDSIANPIDSLDYKHQGTFVWHSNILDRYRNIYPLTDNPDVNNRDVTILELSLKPNDNFQGRSWGGIMRANSSFYENMENYRYIELVARGNVGQLYIDLGSVSEDISVNGYAPNGETNTEAAEGSRIQLHDKGLDGLSEDEESRIEWDCRAEPCRGAEVLPNSANTDPAGDDFEEQDNNFDPSPAINGTENNGSFRIDTEDLNDNYSLDTEERFLRYRIDLEDSDVLVEKEELKPGTNWYRYRIKLEDFIEKNASEADDYLDILNSVRFTRLWYSGVKTAEGQVQIAEFKIVGNSWEQSEYNDDYVIKEDDVTQEVDVNGSVISVTSPGQVVSADSNYLEVKIISNREHSSTYFKSPNTAGETDSETGASLREQSLELSFGNLNPGQSVFATRIFDTDEKDLTQYENLEMEIHLDSDLGEDPPIRFGVRLGQGGLEGADNYYEWTFRPTASQCGDTRACHDENWRANAFSIVMSQLSSLKNGQSPPYLEVGPVRPNTPRAEEREELIRMVGNPSLARINWIQFVIIADESIPPGADGVFWLNDLRVSGVEAKWGTAGRTQVQLDFADVMTLSGSMRYQDGDFATLRSEGASSPLPTRSEARTQMNIQSGLSFNVNKFMKDEWKTRIPMNLTYSSTVSRPYLKPSSDVNLTEDDYTDLFPELLQNDLRVTDTTEERSLRGYDASGATTTTPRSKGYQTFSETKAFSIGYQKEYVKLDNFLLDMTKQAFLERPQLNFSYRQTESRSALNADSTYTWNTAIGYNLGKFSRRDSKPFSSWKSNNWFAKEVRRMTFSPWPQTFDLTLLDLTYIRNKTQDRNPDYVSPLVPSITDYTVDLSHKANLSWTILSWLNLSYNLEVDRDMTYGGDREAFTWENLSSSDKGGFMGLGYIVDYDHLEREVFASPNDTLIDSVGYEPKYDVEGNPITYVAGDPTTYEVVYDTLLFYGVDSLGSREYGRTYGILRNERNRAQDFRVNFNPVLMPFLGTRFSFNSSFNQRRVIPHNYDPYDPEFLDQAYWSLEQSTGFGFRPTLKLRDLFGLFSFTEPVVTGLKKISMRDIRFSWETDLRTTGESYTLAQLFNEQEVTPLQYYMYAFGVGDGYEHRTLWNIITGNTGYTEREDFERFAQYRSARFDQDVYQGGFVHGVSRKASVGSSMKIPWGQVAVSGNLSWMQEFKQSRDYPLYLDTTLTWPKWTLDFAVPNFAQKLEFTKTRLKSLNASSRVGYTRVRTSRAFQSAEDEWSYTWDFTPLLRLSAVLKNDIRLDNSFRFRYERTIRRPKQQVVSNPFFPQEAGTDTTDFFYDTPWIHTNRTTDFTYTFGDDFSLGYDLRTKKGFQLWKWYIRLDNDINLKLTSGFDYTWTRQKDESVIAGYDPMTPIVVNGVEQDPAYWIYTGDRDRSCSEASSTCYPVYAPVMDPTQSTSKILVRTSEYFVRPQAGYNFSKQVQSHAFVEYRYITDRLSNGDTMHDHILMFEIGVMLRFD